MLIVSIDSDALYTPRQQHELRDKIAAGGASVRFETISSDHGHDGFLIEFPQIDPLLSTFLADQAKGA